MPPRKIRTSFRPTTPTPLAKSNTPLLLETPPPPSSPISILVIPKTRLKKTIRYIRRHPDDIKVQVARDYNIPRKTFTNTLKRVDQEPRQYSGQNRGLTIVQERVVDDFIRLQLKYNILPLRAVIQSIIANIRTRDSQVPLSDR